LPQIINYPAKEVPEGYTPRPAGSVRVYVSEADAKQVAASPGGIEILKADKANNIYFIQMANTDKERLANARNEAGTSAKDIATSFGITEPKRSFMGIVGANLGKAADAVGRIGNAFISDSQGMHDYDSEDPEDILTGGGKDNERYEPVVRLVARSLAYINIVLNAQTAVNVQQNTTNAESDTRDQLLEAQGEQKGTASNYYIDMMRPFKAPVTEQAEQLRRARVVLKALENESQREALIQEIKTIGKQIMPDGRPRYEHDLELVR
jgi:hypothetical protein